MRPFLTLLLTLSFAVAAVFAVAQFPALDKLANVETGPIKMKFPDAPISQVFETLGQIGGVKVVAKPEWPKTRVAVEWDAPSLREALVRLAQDNGLDYEVPSPHMLVVVFKGR